MREPEGRSKLWPEEKPMRKIMWAMIFASVFSFTIALTANAQSGQPMKVSVKGGI